MAKPKLCEVIAVVGGKKGEVEKAVTQPYHGLQKPDLFDGLQRTYRPLDEGGEQLPAESKRPQLDARAVMAEAARRWAELFDLTLTLDAGNCKAKAAVVVDDAEILKDVPVTTLLFLEKQLDNVHAFVSKLPTPDPAEAWKDNPDLDMLTTDPRMTARTKKVQKPLVLSAATKEHPAQTVLVTEDVIAGYWSQTLFTTRLPAREKNEVLARVSKLKDAVKVARERANGMEVDKQRMGEAVFAYLFPPDRKK